MIEREDVPLFLLCMIITVSCLFWIGWVIWSSYKRDKEKAAWEENYRRTRAAALTPNEMRAQGGLSDAVLGSYEEYPPLIRLHANTEQMIRETNALRDDIKKRMNEKYPRKHKFVVLKKRTWLPVNGVRQKIPYITFRCERCDYMIFFRPNFVKAVFTGDPYEKISLNTGMCNGEQPWQIELKKPNSAYPGLDLRLKP